METVQIKGVDNSIRQTFGNLAKDTNLVINEKIMTHGAQFAKTEFDVVLNGENASTHVTSRSVAKDASKQEFISKVSGNTKCYGHVECDAIIMDNATVKAIPEILANNIDARLIHEAAIGKIAGEQMVKLMTLGLSEKEAENGEVSVRKQGEGDKGSMKIATFAALLNGEVEEMMNRWQKSND